MILLLVVLAGCSSQQSTTSSQQPTTSELITTTSSQQPVASIQPTTTAQQPTTSGPTTTSSSTTTTAVPPPPLERLEGEVLADGPVRPNYVLPLPQTPALPVVLAAGTVHQLWDEGFVEEASPDSREVVNAFCIEQGLLGVAFHPTDPSRLFVYYTGPELDAQLVELEADATGADPASARMVLSVPQPANRHQAGMVQFGPDGYLYLSIGDGGDGGTQGQNPASLLGTIVRIDVDGDDPYAIPPDNPFAADGAGAPEVIAYGLRNPWRMSIDPVTEVVYVGDVGQDSWEEIDVFPLDLRSYNFGWPVTEGAHCFAEPGCDPAAFDGPALEYGHDEGCSVTGGFVYRGKAIPELTGQYFYSDWCGRWIRSFSYAGGDVFDQREWGELSGFGQINSFGTDHDGELLATTWAGEVARVVAVRQD